MSKQDAAPVTRNTVSSIEARRILAVLEDCRSRIEYSLLLPSLNDFLDGRENLDEEIQVAHAEFLNHQHAISSMITPDGELKQFIDGYLKAREPYYSQASITFDSTDIETASTTESTAARLANILTACQ